MTQPQHNPNNRECYHGRVFFAHGDEKPRTIPCICSKEEPPIADNPKWPTCMIETYPKEPTEVYQCKNQHEDGKYPCTKCEKVPQKEPVEDWEEEFDEKHGHLNINFDDYYTDIKVTVRSLLAKTRQEERDRILREMEGVYASAPKNTRTLLEEYYEDEGRDVTDVDEMIVFVNSAILLSALAEVRAIISNRKEVCE